MKRALSKLSQEECKNITEDIKAGLLCVSELMIKHSIAHYVVKVLAKRANLPINKKQGIKQIINIGDCTIEGCSNPQFSKHICQKHYNKLHKKSIGPQKRTPEQLEQEKLKKRKLRLESKFYNDESFLNRYPTKDYTIINTDIAKLESLGSPKLGLRANLECLKEHEFIVDYKMTSSTQLTVVVSKGMDIAVSLNGLTTEGRTVSEEIEELE